VMDEEKEAEAYDRLSKEFLFWIEDAFVESALNMGVGQGRVLDIGTGPGLIPIKLHQQNPGLEIHAVDMSRPMLEIARSNQKAYSVENIEFSVGDAQSLQYDSDSFDLVVSHSLMHHLPDPIAFLNEAARVAKPDGAILIRDIRRPPQILMGFWVSVFGRGYDGYMENLYRDSLQAAYTRSELDMMVQQSRLEDVVLKSYFVTHIGIEKSSAKGENNVISLADCTVPGPIRQSYVSGPY
ncbi:methyltransferase domain-containing protein, partial [Candidatus Woesearchaeota archaeon]|nr:methyltransferase domain-containing protein [Candidatus Woesearchaeota archaeon]